MVRSWTIKEGRDKQWVSKGPWFGQGKEIEVLAKADLQTIIQELKECYSGEEFREVRSRLLHALGED